MENVKDAFDAVLISIDSSSTHTPLAAAAAPTFVTTA